MSTHESSNENQFNTTDEALEEQDKLPSLPSTSSSLFIASPAHTSSRRRTSSLYGNPSISKSDAVSIEGSSTFEYDVNANIHRQQARRRRGDSNASISTVVSFISRNESVADSMQSYNHYRRNRLNGNDEDDNASVIAHGQFISNQDSSSSIRSGRGANDFYSSNAAESLRRIRKTSGMSARDLNLSLRRRNEENEQIDSTAAADALPGQGSAPHLTDKLERLIANSASYKAVQSRQLPNSTSNDLYNSTFTPRQRKSSYASMRSLIGFNSTSQRQTGDYNAVNGGGPPSRTTSLFGLFMGGGSGVQNANQGTQFSRGYSGLSQGHGTLRSPAYARPSASIPSTTITSSNETLTNPQIATLTKSSRDALGSLRGLRGIPHDPNVVHQRTRTQSAYVRPALKSTFSSNSTSVNGKVDSITEQQVSKRPEGKRHVSFQSHSSRTSISDLNASMNDIKQTNHKPNLNTNNVRRAFMSIDPTSGATYGSGNTSPRTVDSFSPSLNNASRTNSQLSLSSLSKQTRNNLYSHETNGNSGMPPLDEALARAEDRSGLKTSSKCSTCEKKVVNAPVTKSGEVFCSRDCRIEAKQKRKGKMSSTSASPLSNGTAEGSPCTTPTVEEAVPITTTSKEADALKLPNSSEIDETTIHQEPVRTTTTTTTDVKPNEDALLNTSIHKPSQPLPSSRPASIVTTRSASSAKFINADVEDFRAVQAQAKTSNPVAQPV